MTHGEEPGSETHQDSAVLTYLEGLLMHQVAGGPGATGARRSEAGGGRDGGPEPRPPPSRHAPAGHAPAAGPEQDRRPPAGGAASQHLRKARLLRSEEGWAGGLEAGGLRALGAEPAPALNGRGRGEPLQRGGGGGGGALEGSPKCKGGESTLLASLLQSFSSRLQTVALSQQIMQNLKPPEPAPLGQGGARDRAAAAAAAEPRPCLGAASSRLKGFLKKSKTQSHGGMPYRRRPAPGRLAPSPQPPTGGSGKGAGVGTAAAAAASASDSLSCAARLKAVASLVNTRASPAPSPSPRPSVACSQLALLLSSEAHLQQYSREQALKAQLSGRSASERLAAMATQQSQLDPGNPAARPSPDALASPNARNGATLSPPPAGPGAGGGASSPRRTPQPPKERRGFDRSSARPSQNCSSLLLHLLNNHHAQKHANGHAHGNGRPRDYRDDRAARPARPARGSPLPSDGEYSSPENGLPPRDSSDTESSRSSGSPIDLSVRSRAPGAPPGSSSSSSSFASSSFSSSSSSSLDRLTESLINRWRPENPPPPPPLPPPPPPPVAVKKELETGPPVRPHHKVTLLQLLLDHRNGEGGRGQRSSDSPDARQGVAPGLGVAAGGLGVAPGAGRLTPVCKPEESSARSPHGGPGGRGFQAPPSFARGVDSNGGASRYSPCPAPPAQSAPLNLCKSEAPPSNPEADAREPAFTASKLLQNLAQCGLQTPPRTPLPPPKLRADPPVTLLERLNTPILRNGTPLSGMPLAPVVSNGSHVSDAPRTSPANPPSEIQSLLERRTVLQLLLGATGGKEKSPAGGGRRKRAACGGVASEQRPDQSSRRDSPPPDVRVKTEPEEDERAAPEGDDGAKPPPPPPPSWGGGASETLRPLSAAARHADVKPEPVSPGAVPRDGLLSQLLKQRCRSLPVNAPAGAVMSVAAAVKEEPSEPLAPPTEPQAPPAESQAPPTEPQAPPIPKKRRVCIEGFPQERPVSAASGVSGARRSVSRSPERLATQNGGSPLEPDSPSRGHAGNSPPADARGGFNVLKQLLLSDNCLKDLSQLQPRRGSPSPSAPRPSDLGANGTPPARPGHLHKLAASPWDHAPQGSGVADRARSASPPPWGVRDSPKANLVPVKREAEAEGTARWAAGVEEGPDSPRLTQANPILYYMLQKSNSHLGRGGRGARGALCGGGGAQGQPRVKEEEPAPLAEDDDHKLNAKHHPHHPEGAPEGAVERLNGSLEKC